MTIQLAPEMEFEIVKVAAAKGIAPDAYVERAVAEALAWERASQEPEKEDIRVFLDRLAMMAPVVDAHPTATFDREMIYCDDMEKFDL
jgi:hypothetical protein